MPGDADGLKINFLIQTDRQTYTPKHLHPSLGLISPYHTNRFPSKHLHLPQHSRPLPRHPEPLPQRRPGLSHPVPRQPPPSPHPLQPGTRAQSRQAGKPGPGSPSREPGSRVAQPGTRAQGRQAGKPGPGSPSRSIDQPLLINPVSATAPRGMEPCGTRRQRIASLPAGPRNPPATSRPKDSSRYHGVGRGDEQALHSGRELGEVQPGS
jgi:hypothetical protein